MKKRWSILILSAMLALTGCDGQNDKEPETLPVSVEADQEVASGVLETIEKTEENTENETDVNSNAKFESTTEISSETELDTSDEASTSISETESESDDEIQTQTEEGTDEPEPVETTTDAPTDPAEPSGTAEQHTDSDGVVSTDSQKTEPTSASEPEIPPASEPQPTEPTLPSIPESPTVPVPTTVPEQTSVPVPTTEPEPTTVPESTTVPEPTTAPEPTTIPDSGPQETQGVPYERYLNAKAGIDLINEYRMAAGAEPVQWSDGLYAAALIRAKQMYDKKSIDHTGDMGGEIHAMATASFQAVDSWAASPGHYKWMVDKQYKYCAIAFYDNYCLAMFTREYPILYNHWVLDFVIPEAENLFDGKTTLGDYEKKNYPADYGVLCAITDETLWDAKKGADGKYIGYICEDYVNVIELTDEELSEIISRYLY